MNSKKVKKLRKLFKQALAQKEISDYGTQFNIKGKVVEANLWRQFKKQYARGTQETA